MTYLKEAYRGESIKTIKTTTITTKRTTKAHENILKAHFKKLCFKVLCEAYHDVARHSVGWEFQSWGATIEKTMSLVPTLQQASASGRT